MGYKAGPRTNGRGHAMGVLDYENMTYDKGQLCNNSRIIEDSSKPESDCNEDSLDTLLYNDKYSLLAGHILNSEGVAPKTIVRYGTRSEKYHPNYRFIIVGNIHYREAKSVIYKKKT